MKKINMQKIILVLIPVLFIFSGVSKADTFTYNGYTFTMQTDKPIYTEGASGGGDIVTVVTSLHQSPSPSLQGANSSYYIQSFTSRSNQYSEYPQNYFGSDTTYNNYSNNSWSSYYFNFEVGTTATSSAAAAYNNYYSYWDVNRDYRVVNSLEVIPYSGPHDFIAPSVWFNVQVNPSTADNTSSCLKTTNTTTTTPGSTDSYTENFEVQANDSTYSTLVCYNRNLSGSTYNGATFDYIAGDPYAGGSGNGTITRISCTPSSFSHTVDSPDVSGTGVITYSVVTPGTTTVNSSTVDTCAPQIFTK